MELAYIEKFNPWWRIGRVKEDWLREYKRKIFYKVIDYIQDRQIVLLQGLRRVGKTTLLFQIIQNLLDKGINPKQVLYFSFDEISYDLKDVLTTYEKLVLNKTFDELKEKIYICLDEIHKVRDWENKLKVFYDLYPKIKFFVSGSASIKLRRKSKESLAGRMFDFTLTPLDFEEFLQLKGYDVKKIKESPRIWERTIIPLFYQYIKFGTFPEIINETNEEKIKKYIVNDVVERIVYKDLPEEFGIKDTALLKNLVYLIAKNPGMIVNFSELSRNLGKDKRTILNYFEYLEYSLLIRTIFNYRGSPLASLRKLKKVYFTTPNIIFAFNEDLSSILPFMFENLILVETDAKFFFRNNFEVDFILEDNGKLTAIEVKKEGRDVQQIKKFVEKFKKKIKKVLIVDIEKEGKIDGIKIIPAWRFILKRHY